MSDFQEQKREVLTTGEVAKICNVAARTVSKWFDKGDIEGYRIPGSKDRRIPKSSLIKFMKQHGIPLDGLMTGTTRVLVVESDVATRDTLLQVLGDNTGYELRGCENTFVAGIECERFAPHVVLLDTSLPGGAEIVEAMQANEDRTTDFIAVCGRTADPRNETYLRKGYAGCIRKPFTVRQVIDAIEECTSIIN
ncbi:MAG: helix-turn-helix domain-containing protein [Planctomycetota bacterium]|nr:helix-turn-helix domain-containing protein [Planctomycetota bacterium]MED5322738.1 helix-turn-helix domain-containing protein [Planctomycetota bacterium]